MFIADSAYADIETFYRIRNKLKNIFSINQLRSTSLRAYSCAAFCQARTNGIPTILDAHSCRIQYPSSRFAKMAFASCCSFFSATGGVFFRFQRNNPYNGCVVYFLLPDLAAGYGHHMGSCKQKRVTIIDHNVCFCANTDRTIFFPPGNGRRSRCDHPQGRFPRGAFTGA